MPLTALTFELAPDQADALGDALLEHGALAVDVGDALAGTPDEQAVFDEPGDWDAPLRPIRWQRARLAALFEDADSAQRLSAAALTELALDPQLARDTRTVEDADWVALTQREFEPMRIDDGLWIVPSWHQPPEPSAINLIIDPGRAFGSGSHPTTQLCLHWLARTLRGGERVLDYGCGSGVLAIGAAKLGAARVIGIDIDAEAVSTARANSLANAVQGAEFGLPEALAAMTPVDGASSGFDLVVANILARPLVALAPLLIACVRPGGRIALAGLLEAQAESIAQAYAPQCRLTTHRTLDGWALLAGERID
jgi:ribosomal protein L11 methyltransferase